MDALLGWIDKSSVMHLGTSIPEGIPLSTRVVGAYANREDRQLTVYIPSKRSERVLGNLAQNKNVSVLLIDPENYHSLQVKGLYLGMSDCTDEDYRIQDLYFLRMRRHSFPERYYQINRKPALSLRIRIMEAYDQTPGPDAGKRIDLTDGGDRRE